MLILILGMIFTGTAPVAVQSFAMHPKPVATDWTGHDEVRHASPMNYFLEEKTKNFKLTAENSNHCPVNQFEKERGELLQYCLSNAQANVKYVNQTVGPKGDWEIICNRITLEGSLFSSFSVQMGQFPFAIVAVLLPDSVNPNGKIAETILQLPFDGHETSKFHYVGEIWNNLIHLEFTNAAYTEIGLPCPHFDWLIEMPSALHANCSDITNKIFPSQGFQRFKIIGLPNC